MRKIILQVSCLAYPYNEYFMLKVSYNILGGNVPDTLRTSNKYEDQFATSKSHAF